MHREWHGLDRLRLDKFYFLMRQMMSNAFQVLKDRKWNEEEIEAWSKIFFCGETVGIQLFLIESSMQEIEKVCVAPYPAVLLDVFYSQAAMSHSKPILARVEEVFTKVITEKLFDIDEVKAQLFAIGADPKITAQNRKLLYKLHMMCPETAADRVPKAAPKRANKTQMLCTMNSVFMVESGEQKSQKRSAADQSSKSNLKERSIEYHGTDATWKVGGDLKNKRDKQSVKWTKSKMIKFDHNLPPIYCNDQ